MKCFVECVTISHDKRFNLKHVSTNFFPIVMLTRGSQQYPSKLIFKSDNSVFCGIISIFWSQKQKSFIELTVDKMDPLYPKSCLLFLKPLILCFSIIWQKTPVPISMV